ncbi:7-carboxy-7-deazaguanine synthase [subsurface metagenome]|nr:anaerobic ribonucleoside-triphosphate reductase activating protein [Hadesarchaea archaeon]
MKFRLTGITNLSTVDWPGKLVTVVFFQGCDLRCPWCQNVDSIDPSGGKNADTDEVIEHIKRLGPIVDTLVVTGGEPLLQPEACLELLKNAKGLGFYCAMETNGGNPQALERLLPYLDFVAVDIKAPLSDSKLYARVAGQMRVTDLTNKIKESLKLAISSKAEVEARTTVVPTLNDDERIVARIANDVKGVDCLRLQQFRNQCTFNPSFQKLPMPNRERLLELARIAKREGLKSVKIFTVEGGLETV